MNVLDKAKELGQAITETPEWKRLKEAEKAHLADLESVERMEEHNRRRAEIAEQFRKEGISKEELEALRQQMADEVLNLTENAIIREFLDASRAFGEMMGQINSVIGHFVTGDSECDGGSCGGCSGCGK